RLDLGRCARPESEDELVDADRAVRLDIGGDLLRRAVERAPVRPTLASSLAWGDRGAEADADRVGVASRLPRLGVQAVAPGGDFVRRQVGGRSGPDRQPAVAESGSAPDRWLGVPADPDRRVRSLDRVRPRADRPELEE